MAALRSLTTEPARWPYTSTTAAQPCGTCPNCGGQLFALLTHQCTTNAPYRARRLLLA